MPHEKTKLMADEGFMVQYALDDVPDFQEERPSDAPKDFAYRHFRPKLLRVRWERDELWPPDVDDRPVEWEQTVVIMGPRILKSGKTSVKDVEEYDWGTHIPSRQLGVAPDWVMDIINEAAEEFSEWLQRR